MREVIMADKLNFVDERLELVALIFRLAGHSIFPKESTKYQRKLDSNFANLKDHPAVLYVKHSLIVTGGEIPLLAIHLTRQHGMFCLAQNPGFLFSLQEKPHYAEYRKENGYTLYNQDNITHFVKLLNDFYVDSRFADFFHKNTKWYQKQSLTFHTLCVDGFSFEWFRQYGLNPDRMSVVLMPSIPKIPDVGKGFFGFGGWVLGSDSDETSVYAFLPLCNAFSLLRHYYSMKAVIVHEFCHAFANPIAQQWYSDNEQFRKWCDDTVSAELAKFYGEIGESMACEYLTRAYTISYVVENDNADLDEWFNLEKKQGFPHIEKVYELIGK
jgi:hypothetical protein